MEGVCIYQDMSVYLNEYGTFAGDDNILETNKYILDKLSK